MATEEKKKVFTLSEVAAHNTEEDCWLIFDNKVYDVSSFLDGHPGGGHVLVDNSGRDATMEFEDTGHSETAKLMREEFFIGDIDAPTKATYRKVSKANNTRNKSSGELFIISIIKFVVPLAILALALASCFLAKKRELIPQEG